MQIKAEFFWDATARKLFTAVQLLIATNNGLILKSFGNSIALKNCTVFKLNPFRVYFWAVEFWKMFWKYGLSFRNLIIGPFIEVVNSNGVDSPYFYLLLSFGTSVVLSVAKESLNVQPIYICATYVSYHRWIFFDSFVLFFIYR